jgi:hypothetical protein
LWYPRELQGAGRHDNPDLYGCIYGALEPLSVVVEALAPFRASGNLSDSMLVRAGSRLGLSEIDADVEVLDLDDPAVLRRERLRPSRVATRRREVTQPIAAALYEKHPDAGALSWWSTLEASWQNVTVFDRVARRLKLRSTAVLTLDHPVVREAADFLGLRGRSL